ncbi:hypothetical protein BT96DRAFT_981046 [Gymnopus androsaceus JB14]|uniref:Uncharacterized protein n=1 Tax=Gymnopus androsaceus JB14 TaxID=1447944 RepID=A0A6A4GTK1_9AGAR|nr:hypothetical protein BT96DRAFT_981046 [Gymnopus androsaceus JB14]
MLASLSPARDLFALSGSSVYHHLPSPSSLSNSLLAPVLLDQPSFTPSPRQSSFIETSSQRRARVAFLQKQNNREGEKRVENWVREQVQQSAFMITAAQMSAEKVKLILGRMLKDSSDLSSITEEEEEPYIFYSTPSPQYSVAKAPPLSPTKAPRSPTRPSHQRRLSDLAVIPEGPEE